LSLRLACLLILALVLPVGGCGKAARSHDASSSVAKRPTAADVALLQNADCNLWRHMPGDGRRQLLVGFKSFFGARVDAASTSGQRGSVLGDKRAVQLFDRYCRLSFAGRFKLYKIYGRAAAFTTP
jgi:hypothetical protein